MNRLVVVLAVGACISMAALVDEVGRAAEEGEQAPMMVSFTDLKWTEPPEGSVVKLVEKEERRHPPAV